MFESKYYATIEASQRKDPPDDALPPFNLDELGADSWRQRFKTWLIGAGFPPLLFLLREFLPVATIGSFVVVTRDADVRDVLARPQEFEVPFGREMEVLAGGANFVLGLEDPAHEKQRDLIREVLDRKDEDLLRSCVSRSDAQLVAELSNRFAKALIRTSGGRIDVMKDYITRIATEVCARYFGLKVQDPDAFAEWTMSISALLFADPTGDEATRRLALNGAARVRDVIDHSIADMRARLAKPQPDDVSGTVLGRLLLRQKADPDVTDTRIRAILVGLVTGFIPTNTLAAGKILQELLRRPRFMKAAAGIASLARAADERPDGPGKFDNPDRKELQAILLEAARLNPALAPGQWRYVKKEAKIGSRTIPCGKTLVVSTMSAMRDRRAMNSPGAFKPDREQASSELLFGSGIHDCMGKHLAIAQITEIFMVLFTQPNLRPRKTTLGGWGGIKWVGPFPRWLDMDFDPVEAPATQTMVTICAELADPSQRGDVERLLAGLGNPSAPASDLHKMLQATGFVHFASLSLIEAGDAENPSPRLLLEMNVDGSREAAIRSLAKAASGSELEKIFRYAKSGKESLEAALNLGALDLQTRPWGAIGLNFAGTSEFPVADIEMQDQLAAFARAGLESFMFYHARYGGRAMQALEYVRDLMHRPAMRAVADNFALAPTVTASCDALADYLIVPSRKQLKISDWKERTRTEAAVEFAKSWTFIRFVLFAAAVDLLASLAIFFAVGSGWHGLAGRLLLAATGGIAATLLLGTLAVASFYALLYWHDQHDIPEDKDPPLRDIQEVARVENPPGFVQNHFMAVTDLKRGWFRRLTLAASLWGIKVTVQHLFRPGFVLDMGTIHYAKWFRVPGQDKLVFQANYDGSWESYLEDFIMKAHLGQTAAWSNGIGFPRSSFLIYGGAEDGDRFKRWVRRQQVLAPFWYNRYPKLTTDQIRNNALIHDGLARALTESDARAWLDCFGSMPRPDYAIESNEVQSLLFSGQQHLYCTTYALIRLPGDRKRHADWLGSLVPGFNSPHTGNALHVSDTGAIAFGDHAFPANSEETRSAVFVGFTARGLATLGLSGPDKRDGLSTFPATFNMGMANRGRSLGDEPASPASRWHWTDAAVDGKDRGEAENASDAILLIFARDPGQCSRILDEHLELLGDRDKVLIHSITTEPLDEWITHRRDGKAIVAPHTEVEREEEEHDRRAGSRTEAQKTRDRLKVEHFGFRDGISQPVIRGSKRFSKRLPDRDVVEPGEFILGYRNNQGYYPPTASVRAESDPSKHLPVVLQEIPSRFPSFEGANQAARDFGRNGSFLVIRQLQQHVDEFKDFVNDSAEAIRQNYPGLDKATGVPVTSKWVAAKMMGRWPNGTSLVERPEADKGPFGPDRLSNDFSYGRDDPQGLRCPFGAHTRRANPRDSMQPEDPSQVAITNRHRLLRRGRTYAYQPAGDGKTEKGLLFTCLCADLDRQFEFVQQTWVNSPSFHGLRDEPDPMVGWPSTDSHFTIPTTAGPVQLKDMKNFVTVRAGGYFFMPSRSALRHLADLNK